MLVSVRLDLIVKGLVDHSAMARTLNVVKIALLFVFIITVMQKTYCQWTADYVDRHNIGVVLHNVGKRWIATSMAKVVFHFKLPPRRLATQKQINCTLFEGARARMTCRTLKNLFTTFVRLETEAATHLQHNIFDIYDVLQDFRVQNRGRRGFFSDVLSEITGLATQGDVDELYDVMNKIEEGVQHAADVWTTGTKSILSAFQVQNVRFLHIERLLDLQRKSVLELQTELTDLYIQTQRGSALFGKMFERLSDHIFQVTEVANVFNSINLLAVGRLSHLFVSHAKLRNSLLYLEHYLNRTHPDLALVRKDPSYYFRNAKFNTFRYGRHLIILLHVPLTLCSLASPLNLYHVVKIPLPAPTNETHYTELSCDYEAIAYSRDSEYYLPIRHLSSHDNSDIIDLSQTDHILKSRRFMTCPLSLFEAGRKEVSDLCGYHVVVGEVPRRVFKIADNKLLFSNVNHATLTCDNGQTAHDVASNETLFVISLPCGCILTANENFIPASSVHCVQLANISLDLEMQYLVNIPYINAFFDQDMLSVVRDDSYLNHTVVAVLPELQIASKEYDVTLSLERKAKFKMDTIINKTKQDIDSYTSLSHYLYNVLLKGHTHERTFDWFNIFDILLFLASIAGLVALGLSIIMHIRLRSVMLLLAKSSKVLAQEAPGLITYPQAKMLAPTVQPPVDYLYFHKTVKELVPIDLSMMFFLIFLIVFLLAYLFYKYVKSTRMRTTLLLEVSDGDQSLTWTLHSLPLAPSFYRFHVDKQNIRLVLANSVYGTQLLWGNGFTVVNTVADIAVIIPMQVRVQCWKAAKLRQFMRGRYYIMVHVLGTNNELLELILLREYGLPEMTGLRPNSPLTINPNVTAVYPSLTVT